MKKIILVVLSFLVIYYGMFNNERPILLFCLFLSFAVLLYFFFIRKKLSIISFRSLRNVKMKDFFIQMPIQLVTLIAVFLIKLNVINDGLIIAFLVFKVIVIIEFLVLFLIQLSLEGMIEKE